MGNRLLAVDPGKHLVGACIFIDGKFNWGGVVEFESRYDLWLAFNGLDTLVCEIPQVYPGPRREDPNDLIHVALTAGAVLACPARQWVVVRPHEWKGSIPKAIHHKRLLATAEEKALKAFEGVKKSLRHNLIDAYGIGRWYLGKM